MAEIIIEWLAFLVVGYVVWKYVVPLVGPMLKAQQERIREQVASSQEAIAQLNLATLRVERAEADARKEVAKIRDDARADATRISEELREQADRDVERIRQRGQEQLVAQRDHLVRVLRAELGSQSLELAERVVRALLADEDRRSATVDHFLDDLDTLGDRAVSGAGASISQGGAS